jgi:DNA polymerase III sliding clamp (beta) subunit (PCNA family)
MESKTKIKNAGRRRSSNRHAGHYRLRGRVGTSSGQPVHIGFYLNPLLDGNGGVDREKIVERFNTEYYG